MKKALFAMFSTIVIIIFILIFFTLHGKSVRQTEINNALESSMRYAMELLLFDEGRPETNAEWETLFLESLVVQIESKSELTVHIYEIDLENGILSAEAILTFKHPIGTTGSVSTGKRTIILEEYIMPISTTELRENLNKYITLSKTEDIYITKHGEVVAKLVNPNQDRIKKAESLFGILPADADIDIKKNREERILKKWMHI